MTLNPVEVFGAVLTLVSIWLATKENIWYYPTGLVALVVYTWLFYDGKLYAESLLQVICFALMGYGWYEWLHGGERRTELPVSRTPRWAWLVSVISGCVATAITVWIQITYTDNPVPWVDSPIFAWSLVAQWMTARKWLESWVLWLVINTVSIPLYYSRGWWITVALYAGLWILAITGYRDWRRSLAASA